MIAGSEVPVTVLLSVADWALVGIVQALSVRSTGLAATCTHRNPVDTDFSTNC